MTSPTDAFSKMVPGFDFLQGLARNASAALPGMGPWITPTLDPEALDKRIDELRTVQFWLEQNARLLGTTIQALEVQRMTLTTLKSMNVSMADLTESLKASAPKAAPPAPEAAAEPPQAPAGQADPATPASAPPGVDPLQWWGALTQQFSQIAASALKDGNADAARALAQQGLDAAGASFKTAAAMPAQLARSAADATAKVVGGVAGTNTTARQTTAKKAASSRKA